MDNMEYLVLIFSVIPALITSITISPNGNSPEIKMIGGMMVDMQKGFVPMTTPAPTVKSNYEKSRKLNLNATKLSINERYRRLIPYMTFYYANDQPATTEVYDNNVEVERVEIVEAPTDRQPKKIIHTPYRNVPRYQGNRLNPYNTDSASAILPKIYKARHNYQAPIMSTNYNYYLTENNVEGHDYRKFAQRPSGFKIPSASLAPATRKPYLNFFQNEDSSRVQYYLTDKDAGPKYKLVPYEQTPPVKVVTQPNNDMYDVPTKSVPLQFSQEPVYLKQRQQQHLYTFDNQFFQKPSMRKPPTVVSESYYEKLRPLQHEIAQPVIESGFRPIVRVPAITTEAPLYTSTVSDTVATHVIEDLAPVEPINQRPNYYQYVVEKSPYKPAISPKATLGDLLDSLQLNKSVPKPLTKDNVGSSIRTLIQVLNTLRAEPLQNVVEPELINTPKQYDNIAQKEIVPLQKPIIASTEAPTPNEVDLHEEPYLATVQPPSQHIDEHPTVSHGSSQRFPLQIENEDEGGTPGRPGEDYPVLTTIPHTSFDCKTQRYKGFFADPETRCQVWHYCDLNGGQASFLCPNGTIFSQAGLTCDWWFNVRCASTTQLYVLNESLYKYILPHSPKFPEDYSGPLVDKYLTLKFKEMEEQFRKNKNKQTASEKSDSVEYSSNEEESSNEDTTGPSGAETTSEVSVSESSVRIESPGTSGNVERLQ